MSTKKPYIQPSVARVVLDHDQAILSACSLLNSTATQTGAVRNWCRPFACKNANQMGGMGMMAADSAARPS